MQEYLTQEEQAAAVFAYAIFAIVITYALSRSTSKEQAAPTDKERK